MQRNEIKNNLYSLLKLAIPLAFTGIVESSVFFFETIFLAHLGKDVLAAGALVSWLFAIGFTVKTNTWNNKNAMLYQKHLQLLEKILFSA